MLIDKRDKKKKINKKTQQGASEGGESGESMKKISTERIRERQLVRNNRNHYEE